MNRLRTNIVMLLILLTVSIGRSAEPSFNTERRQNGGTNKWQIQVGWVHQWGRGVTMSDHSPSLLNGRYLGSSVLPTLTYPDNAAIIAREFNDGYVRLDYWTGDAGLLSGPNPERYGMTWNWGNDRARQYNYDSGNHPTLTYHIDRGTVMDDAITVTQGATSDDIPTQGVEVKTTYLLYSWTNGCGDASSSYTNVFFNIDLALGLAWFPTTKQQFNRSTSRNVFAVMERYTFLDYYGVTTAPGGPWPALVVPYLGTYGSATDAGPIIPVTPESADLASGLMGTYSDNVMIESRLWHLRSEVGLVFTKPFYKHFNVYLSPQFVLEFIDMSVQRVETLTFTPAASYPTDTLEAHTESAHELTVEPGFLLTAGIDYRINEQWYAGVSLGWEWLFDRPSICIGSQSVQFDLDGGEFSLYLGRSL